jgi:hypothetical protein
VRYVASQKPVGRRDEKIIGKRNWPDMDPGNDMFVGGVGYGVVDEPAVVDLLYEYSHIIVGIVT